MFKRGEKMSSEFLMPQKYEGNGCGLTVAVCGLNNEIQYDKMLIYIKEREENQYEVNVDPSNPFQTTKVTFNNLEEKRIYHVVAKIRYDDIVREFEVKMVPSVAKQDSEKSLFLLKKTRHKSGGKSQPPPKIKARGNGGR